jgi:hypothetical protein
MTYNKISRGRYKKGHRSSIEKIDIYATLRHRYKKDASSRGYSFELTKEQFNDIVIKPCFYCSSTKESKQMYNNWGLIYYTGIDRVDNTKGYIIENCVPCCKQCNIKKKAITPDIIKKAYHFLFGMKNE